jgi:hypothetical protein
MTYRLTLRLPCGTRHIVSSVAEATLMITMGWQLVCMRGRCMAR